ncbi:MAG: protease inhibitor I42 family protein [Methanomassiliicoccales archaeon]|nr:protease inhibitor I42 family protein [Methanomassiliicoccales archaeon]
MHLRTKDAGRSVRVKVKERIDLVLEENPTTGYGWQMAQLPALLELVDSDYLPDTPQRCGSGGRKVFHFVVARPGSGSLRLEYRRSWEKDVEPARVFEVSLESA